MHHARAIVLAATLLLTLLAGCAEHDGMEHGATPTATTTAPVAEGLVVATDLAIRGNVLDDARNPIEGATVAVQELGRSVVTSAGGGFLIPVDLAQVYTLHAAAPGHLNATLFTSPELTPVTFVLTVDRSVREPYSTTMEFQGHLDCAADTLIIPGSCTLFFPNPAFTDTANFTFGMEPDWTTVVFDLAASSEQPTLEGLRVTLRGANDSDVLGTYEQYARFGGSWSFSQHITPGQNYTDGVGPVPTNLTAFQVDVYPQGLAYHQACVPPGEGGTCFTGVGVAANVEFDLLVTVFYVEPAPEGFTRLA